MICPMFGDNCKYCSEITRVSVFTVIRKDTRTGMFIPVKQGSKTLKTGEHFCNNDGKHTVSELHYCPKRWAIASSKTAIYLGGLKRAKTKTKVAQPKTKPRVSRPEKPGRKAKKAVKCRKKHTTTTTKNKNRKIK